MGLKTISRTAALIDAPTLRRHLKLDPPGAAHEDDEYIAALLAAAVRLAEHHTQHAVGEKTLQLALDRFPDGAIEMPESPVRAVLGVSYTGADGQARALDPAAYVLDDFGDQHWLLPAYAVGRWPVTQATANAVVITYTAGELLAEVRAALLIIVCDLYDNPGKADEQAGYNLPARARSLLNVSKVWGV